MDQGHSDTPDLLGDLGLRHVGRGPREAALVEAVHEDEVPHILAPLDLHMQAARPGWWLLAAGCELLAPSGCTLLAAGF